MGNSSGKMYHRPRRKYASEYSLGDLIGGSCTGNGGETLDEGYRRPASCISRRSDEVTVEDRRCTSKTIWPIARSVAAFLPEFKMAKDSARSDYRILELVAMGAYGRVYKVCRISDHRVYALKAIGKAKVMNENGAAQVKREVAIQRLVGHHPFVASILEYWQGGKTLYIAMEYFRGGELLSLIEDYKCLPEAVVRIYVGEIGLALDFLRDAGIVHRDIKTTNILLDDEGHAVLTDFGLAKRLAIDQRTSTLCGTPEYMAPEILDGATYGYAVDWWSLGVLACFALTEQYPIRVCADRTEPVNQLDSRRIATAPATYVSLPSNADRLSNAAIDLLRRLLRTDPTARIRSTFGLQRIAFYMGHDIRKYITREISPLILLGCRNRSSIPVDHPSFRSFDSFR